MDKRKILIVDDISSIRFAIQDYLSSLFEVFTANDGEEALQIVTEEHSKSPFDLVLSDIRMPGMNGIELIQQIQNNFPSIQYALMTAYDVNDYVEYARKYRIWNIIPKSAFLDLEFVKVMAQKLTGSELFGFKLQFPDLIEQQVSLGQVYRMHRDVDFRLPDLTLSKCSISSDEERFRICDMVSELLRRHRAPPL
ncbi:MAG: response regulator, partial [Leptonema sp. (in: Bacteria)]|nr:response regulator [Leptonema sp. (in: bacteria)]